MDGGAWWAAVHGVAKSRTWLSGFPLTFHFHALEKEMATHSSVLAWRIPGMGEPGGPPSMGSHGVGHDWSDLAAAAAACYITHHPIWWWLGEAVPIVVGYVSDSVTMISLHTNGKKNFFSLCKDFFSIVCLVSKSLGDTWIITNSGS